MSLEAALGIATSGLSTINLQLALVSHNVANASTTGYAKESLGLSALTAGGMGMGVRAGVARREVDTLLQNDLFAQSGVVAGLQTTSTALSAVDAALGTPGQGNDLSGLLGRLRDAFSTLSTDPSSDTSQSAVVGAASTLASGVNAMSRAIGAQRQAAQDGLADEVGTLNTALSTVNGLTGQVVKLAAAGQSTADLESQRDVAMQQVSQLTGVKWVRQSNGGLIGESNGLVIPLDGASTATFSIGAATVGASSSYPATLPGLMLNGTDVTRLVTGGQIGANLALRDSTLPAAQAGLDEFAHTLATRFDDQGLRLFTDANGAVPAAGTPAQQNYVGFAGTIQVNPAVSQTPSLVRDGTQAVAGSSTGASAFTPNPPGGPAGFGTMIRRVLDYSFGPDVQASVPQPAASATGLGVDGTLSAPYAGGTLGQFATGFATAQAQASSTASDRLDAETAVQSTLQAKVSASAAVSVDDEMSRLVQLQNAYGANAKVIAAVQSMWTDLLGMMQP